MRCTHCANEVKPVVCLDIDGTMADYHGHFLKFAAQWLGIEDDGWAMEYDGSEDLATYMDIEKRLYRQIKLAFRQGGMKRSAPMFPHANVLARNLRSLGVEVWVTTTRPYLRMDNIDPDTREWLSRNGIPFDHLHYDDDKYSSLLDMVDRERIVCVLDDDPKQVSRALEVGIEMALWRRTRFNSSALLPATVRVPWSVPSLQDAEQVIIKLLGEWRAEHGD